MTIATENSGVNERLEFLVVRSRFSFTRYCHLCGLDNEFVSLDDAVLESGISMRGIANKVESGEFHFVESDLGHLFVCTRSIKQLSNEPKLSERGHVEVI